MNSRKLISMISLLLLLLVMTIPAFALEAVTVEISFAVKNAPGTVVIEAVDDAPLPEQTVFETATEGVLELSFSEPGNYEYKIYQKPGTGSGVTYDSTVYSVCVAVFTNEDGSLYCVVAANIEGSAQKADDVVFENTVEPTSPSTPGNTPQTGDDSRLGLWILLMALSLVGIVAFSVFGIVASRRSEKRKQK